MPEARASVTIYKFNPEVDRQPRYVTYDNVPYQGQTVLDVLKYIYENLDPDLAFRYSCRTEPCVVCSVKVNGKNELSCCRTAEPGMVVEPPGKSPQVIKDLVVDFKGPEWGANA